MKVEHGPQTDNPTRACVFCPTPCDDDCKQKCHEAHQVQWKRSHQPSDCPSSWVGRAVDGTEGRH